MMQLNRFRRSNRSRACWSATLALLLSVLVTAAQAQPASDLFGAHDQPTGAATAPLGSYAKGCLDGALRLADDGPNWQAMRLSRNRHWGHGDLIAFVERLSVHAEEIGWPGLLIGDIGQPRGGPMRSGHRSHQIGLDVDIWMRPAPERRFSAEEREQISSWRMVAADRLSVKPDLWSDQHDSIIRAAAEDEAVARIFVNAAIKKQLCTNAAKSRGDSGWLRKVRPWWGHDAHFHVRLHCPEDAPRCVDQAPPPAGDGCDALDWWFSDEALNPKPSGKPRVALTLADLPGQCSELVDR